MIAEAEIHEYLQAGDEIARQERAIARHADYIGHVRPSRQPKEDLSQDRFVRRDEVYVNEVNTLPGFTSISMYPKLWEASGLAFPALCDRLLALAVGTGTTSLAILALAADEGTETAGAPSATRAAP